MSIGCGCQLKPKKANKECLDSNLQFKIFRNGTIHIQFVLSVLWKHVSGLSNHYPAQFIQVLPVLQVLLFESYADIVIIIGHIDHGGYADACFGVKHCKIKKMFAGLIKLFCWLCENTLLQQNLEK